MTSEKQMLANRRNSKRSTGPSSEEGKEIVRFNAVKHGMCSESLLPGEDASEIELLSESLFSELEPNGKVEEMLAERIVMLSWRLQRLSQIEMGLFIQQFCEQILNHEFAKADKRPGVTTDGHMRTTIVHRKNEEDRQKVFDKVSEPQAKARIEYARERMNTDMALMGAAYRRDAQRQDTLSKLLRYETTLEKSLLRCMHELQRLQAARAGQEVLPPVAIDINLSAE